MRTLIFALALLGATAVPSPPPQATALCASKHAGALVRAVPWKGNRLMVRCQQGRFIIEADGKVRQIR